MQNVFNKRKEEIDEFNTILEELNFRNKKENTGNNVNAIPDDLMVKCRSCGRGIFKEEFISTLKVCPFCGYNDRLLAKERLDLVLDKDYEILFTNLEEKHLDFPGYQDKIDASKKASGIDESVLCAKGTINGIKTLVAAMDSHFMMGSMGSVCGERITLLCEKAIKEHLPVIIFTCSGGARMQEGIISLFQMAKTSQAVAKLREHELYISVLTDPTTGGVSASFASLADITLAEPKTLIGFAGKRVIEKTIREVLPKEFQTSEFLLEKGFMDNIVERKDMKSTLSLLLRLHNYK